MAGSSSANVPTTVRIDNASPTCLTCSSACRAMIIHLKLQSVAVVVEAALTNPLSLVLRVLLV